MKAFISELRCVLGELTLIDTLPEFISNSDALERSKNAGMKWLSLATISPPQFFKRALSEIIQNIKFELSTLDAIVLSDFCIPSLTDHEIAASLAQLGLGGRPTLKINGGQCCNSLLVLKVASSLVQSGMAQRVLFLAISCLEQGIPRTIDQFNLLSDGAVGGIVQNTHGDFSIDYVEHTSWKQLSPDTSKELGVQPSDEANFQALCYSLTTLIDTALEKTKTKISDYRALISENIFPNLNSVVFDFPEERIFSENIERRGHIGDCDYFINIIDYHERYGFRTGDKFIVIGAAAYTHAVALCTATRNIEGVPKARDRSI
jgi:3-oxoacyl-[acyl-carrier-protein] synthase III